MAGVSRKLEASLEKYHLIKADFLEIINMDVSLLERVHPYCFSVLQSGNKDFRPMPILRNLAYILPESIYPYLTDVQISAFYPAVLSQLSESLLKQLTEKFKGVTIDYHEDMYYKYASLDLSELFNQAWQLRNKRESRFTQDIQKDIQVFHMSHMISSIDIARILRFDLLSTLSSNKYLKDLERDLTELEIQPHNQTFYNSIKSQMKMAIYDYDKVVNWLLKGYEGTRGDEDFKELVSYQELLKILLPYFTTHNMETNRKVYELLRHTDLPHIALPYKWNKHNLYFSSEIEEIIHCYLKTGILKGETGYKKPVINTINA